MNTPIWSSFYLREGFSLWCQFQPKTLQNSKWTVVKLTYFYLIDLTDVTLAPEDANSKLFNVVSVAESDVDVGDSLDFEVQYMEAKVWLRFPLS